MPTEPHTLVAKIFDAIKADREQEPRRGYLGASNIGHECGRYLWYSFRHAFTEDLPGRLYRLFDRGHREEPAIIEDLRRIGVQVWDADPNGRQFGVEDVDGHFRGHLDGVGKGIPGDESTPYLLEFKTASEKTFAKFEKEGVGKTSTTYMAQMQVYMGKMNLPKALFVMVNKNTDALYIEVLDFDPDAFRKIIDRAREVVNAKTPLPKISDKPSWYKCKMCSAHAICHKRKIPDAVCRTCCYAEPIEKGRWWCHHDGSTLSKEEQSRGCRNHVYIPDLIPGELVDVDHRSIQGVDWPVNITYKIGEQEVKNGPGGTTSKEMEGIIYDLEA